MNFLNFAIESKNKKESIEKYLIYCLQSLQDLESNINNIFDFASIFADKFELHISQVKLIQFLKAISN